MQWSSIHTNNKFFLGSYSNCLSKIATSQVDSKKKLKFQPEEKIWLVFTILSKLILSKGAKNDKTQKLANLGSELVWIVEHLIN